jgi:hypothetical protein
MISFHRPRFRNVGEYTRMIHQARREGWDPWEPCTLDEWLVYLKFYPHLRPARGVWRELDAAIEAQEPLPDEFREKFLMTLHTRPTFARASRKLMEVAS